MPPGEENKERICIHSPTTVGLLEEILDSVSENRRPRIDSMKFPIALPCLLSVSYGYMLSPYPSRKTDWGMRLRQSNNGEDTNGGLVTSADAKSQLFNAFAALDVSDQYDAVLTGLCAKILDDRSIDKETVRSKISDPTQLLEEMNEKRIPASARSLMALIDTGVKAESSASMARIMSLSFRNNGVQQYGSRQADINLFPPTPGTIVTILGSKKTRQERLVDIELPMDERGTEIASAIATGGVLLACTLTTMLGFDSLSPIASLVFFSIIIVGIVDNFYDVVKAISGVVAVQIKKDAEIALPEKSSLPFGLGTGQVTGTVVRGFTRLLTADPSRQALVEGAALYVAYVLSLPCYAYRPNSLESAILVADSVDDESMDSLWSSSGILRTLTWLMAPVAAEAAKYPVCICSEPREGLAFLERLERYADENADLEVFWDSSERTELCRWAFAEADLLLRENKKVVTEICNRLEGGAATIADCVAVIENW